MTEATVQSSPDDRFNPMDYRIAMELRPKRVTARSAWVSHIPFAFALVQMCQPRVVVELGTHKGDSYCAFCQAVTALGLPTKLTAIDTWQGDPHAGAYGPEVLAELRAHHDPLYGGFSTLLQSTFDEALPRFADGSIDLLHIDGFHSYEAVRHDYDTWLPKIGDRGVMLFHDTRDRRPDFGVWRLWEELARPDRLHFQFPFGAGLGVLAMGSDAPPALLRFRCEGRRADHN
jgi:O-antigen biosynthesis protein